MKAPCFNIETLDDLIQTAKLYNSTQSENKDVQKLHKILPSLHELDSLVGLLSLKTRIVKHIVYFLQGFAHCSMMHTVIMGPPGVGKTTVANIIAKMYAQLGFLSKGNVMKASRQTLIGQYMGETAIKTQAFLESCIGNVLLIDEAYSLGSESKSNDDTYAQECMNTLNEFLSTNASNFVCIVVGYESTLKNAFFSMNVGLERRFPWRYTLDQYTPAELTGIFFQRIEKSRWKVRVSDVVAIKRLTCNKFKSETAKFRYCGGDVEKLVQYCMMEHAMRVFGSKKHLKKTLNIDDVSNGFSAYDEQQDQDVL